MDTGFTLKHENPKSRANCLSKLFFTWMLPLFYKGTQRGLEVIDLYKTLNCDMSAHVGDKLEKKLGPGSKPCKAKAYNPPV
ncbi:hypothetical protein NQ315_008064 [Exocentrus adspersus]|uniref:Uncharacterized protein n=1 Tax=Exocentrus adspersus TaxID=1586481 RepID=A0AAV8VW10_9CUCU|nr:hypothetical protein NQ315_008064 [Exocentrus adspersus]